MRIDRIKLLFIVSFCLLILSCAQIRPLKGGEKDTVPPVALSVYPPHLSTSFTSKQIVFYFDEYIQLNNITQELIVSPPLAKQPKIRIKQKSLVITLDEELLPNTTYTFNFGDGVVDLNEGNKANDLVYVFSTGNSIDSLSMKGKVLDAYTMQPAVGYRVMLFESDTTITSKKSRPVYFAKTKADGSYILNYLRGGNFYLYALNDENSNFRADEGEHLALVADPVSPVFNDSSVTVLYVSKPRPLNPQVDSYVIDSCGYIAFKWDPYFAGLAVESINDQISESLILERDSAFVRFKGKPTDKVENVVVSFGKELQDTIRVPFYTSAQISSFNINSLIEKKHHIDLPLMLNVPLWARLADSTYIELKRDTIAVPFRVEFSGDSGQCIISAPMEHGKDYSLSVWPGAFINESGGTNDTLKVDYSTYKGQELGSLKFVFTGDQLPENSVFILTDKSEKIIFRADPTKKDFLVIDKLPAADYTARIWVDENRNQIFDPLIPLEKKQPEKVFLFPQTITVRANWELNLDWKISVEE